MKLESLAHLAGLMGCISQLNREGIPPAMRTTFSFMQNEIMNIVRTEGDEEPFKLLMQTAASIYSQIAPHVDKATEGKSKEEIEEMLKMFVKGHRNDRIETMPILQKHGPRIPQV